MKASTWRAHFVGIIFLLPVSSCFISFQKPIKHLNKTIIKPLDTSHLSDTIWKINFQELKKLRFWVHQHGGFVLWGKSLHNLYFSLEAPKNKFKSSLKPLASLVLLKHLLKLNFLEEKNFFFLLAHFRFVSRFIFRVTFSTPKTVPIFVIFSNFRKVDWRNF